MRKRILAWMLLMAMLVVNSGVAYAGEEGETIDSVEMEEGENANEVELEETEDEGEMIDGEGEAEEETGGEDEGVEVIGEEDGSQVEETIGGDGEGEIVTEEENLELYLENEGQENIVVSLGGRYSAAVTTDGELYCWGSNDHGQVGNGTMTDQSMPVKILSGVRTVSLGDDHSAAVTTDGDLYCWGENYHGQVGNGTTTDQTTPVKILSGVRTVSLGLGHSAAVTKNGDLYCWGYNHDGEVGNGTTKSQLTPVKVLSGVRTVSLGEYHSAAVTTDGELYCWGDNDNGQVGNGTTTDQLTPVKVLSGVRTVSLGRGLHSAAVTTDGELYCWGDNHDGEVGNGTTTDQSMPVKILSEVKTVSLGGHHSAAVTTDGELYCWGDNYYRQVGNGASKSQLTPVKILSGVRTVSLGEHHGAAVTTDGDLYCWGYNYNGQVGNGTTANQSRPVKILSGVRTVLLGTWHSAAVTMDGDLYCWGSNDRGKIGNGTTEGISTPVKVLENVCIDDPGPTTPDDPGDISEEERQNAYTEEHLNFIESAKYKERMDTCWASTLSQGLDTTTGKIGEALYDTLNTVSELLSGKCKSLSVFDNPYDAVITELILAQAKLKQTDLEIKYKNELLSNISKLESICEKADPEWSLKASEYKTCLEKLIADPVNYKETNPAFYEMCEKIFGGAGENDELNKLLNGFGKANQLMNALNTYANVINWVADCLKYNALVEAYLSTSDEFKQSLKDAVVYMALNASGDEFISRVQYGNLYAEAYEKFAAFQTTDNITELLFKEYVSNGADRIESVFGSAIVKNSILYVSEGLGISAAAASWLYACIEAYKTGWAISEAITNNGTNIECRELIRAYYYLEDAMKWQVETDESNLRKEPTYAKALKFDASYTIMKNLECAVLDVYVKYLNCLQTSLFQGILHFFGDFTKTEVTLAEKYKLDWSAAKCHSTGVDSKQYKTYSTVNVCCPTDVFVYNKEGQLVYSIEDNAVTLKGEEGIEGAVVGTMKFLTVADISEYEVHIIAADDGTMQYQVNTYDAGTGDLLETASYLDVALAEGDDYTGTFQEKILLEKNGNEIEPDSRSSDVSTTVLVSSVEISEEEYALKKGDIITLNADFGPADATFPVLNWTSSDEEVASVDEKGVVTANGAGECTIQCSTIDGSGIYDTAIVKVAGIKKGDINQDGDITMTDLMMCLHHVSGRTVLTDNALLAADIDDDGTVKMVDLMKILHYVSGRNSNL